MQRKTRKVVPMDIGNVEFTKAPFDGAIAVEQRLRNLMEIAIAIQTRNALSGDTEKIKISDDRREKECHQSKE